MKEKTKMKNNNSNMELKNINPNGDYVLVWNINPIFFFKILKIEFKKDSKYFLTKSFYNYPL